MRSLEISDKTKTIKELNSKGDLRLISNCTPPVTEKYLKNE